MRLRSERYSGFGKTFRQHLPKGLPEYQEPGGDVTPARLSGQGRAWCDTGGVNSRDGDCEREPDGGRRRFVPRDEFVAESQVAAAVELDAFRADQLAAQYDAAAVEEV
jgi:hypothetical protein